jgi:hypothetical protein
MITIHKMEKMEVYGETYYRACGEDLAAGLEIFGERVDDIPDILSDVWRVEYGRPAEYEVVERPDYGSMILRGPDGERYQVQEWVLACGDYWRPWSEVLDWQWK